MNHRTDGARTSRERHIMMLRARLGLLAAMGLMLIAAAHAPHARGALDPAASWRTLLAAAGCPPVVAHDLAVRIERLAGRPPGPGVTGELTAAQRAGQIAHLAMGRHGLQLTTAQLDAAIAALVSSPATPDHGSGAGSDRSAANEQSPSAPAASASSQPFTTRHAHELLREWLPSPAQR